MNAPIEFGAYPTFDESPIDETGNVELFYMRRIDAIEHGELRKNMGLLLSRIAERTRVHDLGRALTLIHNIPLEWTVLEGITHEDIQRCSSLYTDLLKDNDALIAKFVPGAAKQRVQKIL